MRLIRWWAAARHPRRLRGRRPSFPPKPDFAMSKTLLQINTVVNSGSTGRIAEEIGQTAIAAGWRSVIAYGRNPRPSKSELIRIGNDWDVRLHGLRSRVFDDHGFGSRRATEAFIREAEKLNPTVVHLHNLHGFSAGSRGAAFPSSGPCTTAGRSRGIARISCSSNAAVGGRAAFPARKRGATPRASFSTVPEKIGSRSANCFPR